MQTMRIIPVLESTEGTQVHVPFSSVSQTGHQRTVLKAWVDAGSAVPLTPRLAKLKAWVDTRGSLPLTQLRCKQGRQFLAANMFKRRLKLGRQCWQCDSAFTVEQVYRLTGDSVSPVGSVSKVIVLS